MQAHLLVEVNTCSSMAYAFRRLALPSRVCTFCLRNMFDMHPVSIRNAAVLPMLQREIRLVYEGIDRPIIGKTSHLAGSFSTKLLMLGKERLGSIVGETDRKAGPSLAVDSGGIELNSLSICSQQ